MQIMVVLGSPRQNSNSSILARELSRGAKEAGAQVEEVFLKDLDINPCQACQECRAENATGCVQEDDMGPLYYRLKSSDGLVLATPVYWWGVSAQLKAFIDRWYAFGARGYRELAGKRLALAVVQGGKSPILSGADLVTRMVKDICGHVKMEFVGLVNASAYDPGVVSSQEEVLAQARDLGRKLVEG